MQKEIIIALVASFAAFLTSLISAYVSIRGQKRQEKGNSISSKLDFLNQKVGMLEKVKNEIVNTENEEITENHSLEVEAVLRVQDIYFKHLKQIQSIDHYIDKGKLDEILKKSKAITSDIAQLKILASKEIKEALESKELSSIMESQPHQIMVEEIENIENLINIELRDTIFEITKLINIK